MHLSVKQYATGNDPACSDNVVEASAEMQRPTTVYDSSKPTYVVLKLFPKAKNTFKTPSAEEAMRWNMIVACLTVLRGAISEFCSASDEAKRSMRNDQLRAASNRQLLTGGVEEQGLLEIFEAVDAQADALEAAAAAKARQEAAAKAKAEEEAAAKAAATAKSDASSVVSSRTGSPVSELASRGNSAGSSSLAASSAPSSPVARAISRIDPDSIDRSDTSQSAREKFRAMAQQADRAADLSHHSAGGGGTTPAWAAANTLRQRSRVPTPEQLDKMPASEVIKQCSSAKDVNQVMAMYARRGQPQLCTALLAEMEKAGYSPDATTHKWRIRAFVEADLVEQALEVHDALPSPGTYGHGGDEV